MDNTKYHLILTIVMEGYLNQVMTAAKRVGASGGTVIKGRGQFFELAKLAKGSVGTSLKKVLELGLSDSEFDTILRIGKYLSVYNDISITN